MSSTWEDYLKKIYYDPNHPASFEGIQKLYDTVKKDNKYKISYRQICEWLQSQNTYSLNKAVKRNFSRGRVIVSGIDDQWDADLASFIPLSESNNGYMHLLFVIDIFSRYGWVAPLKNKTAKEIVQGFKAILAPGRKPRHLRTDAAYDFRSNEFQQLLKDKSIVHFTTHSEKQANYVERFIKTIKSRIYRYIVGANSDQYIDILPKLLDSYNRSWHSGIQWEPINVDKTVESRQWWQMYWPKDAYVKDKSKKKKKTPFAFKVGDKV